MFEPRDVHNSLWLAKAAMRRAHRNRITTPEQRQDRMLDDMAEDIVNAMLSM